MLTGLFVFTIVFFVCQIYRKNQVKETILSKIGFDHDLSFQFNDFVVNISKSSLKKSFRESLKNRHKHELNCLAEFIYEEYIFPQLKENVRNATDIRNFLSEKGLVRPAFEEESVLINRYDFFRKPFEQYMVSVYGEVALMRMEYIHSLYLFGISTPKKYVEKDNEIINKFEANSFIENLFGFSGNLDHIENNIKQEKSLFFDLFKVNYPYSLSLTSKYKRVKDSPKNDISISDFEEVNHLFDLKSFYNTIKDKVVLFKDITWDIHEKNEKEFNLKINQLFKSEKELFLFVRGAKTINVKGYEYVFCKAFNSTDYVSIQLK
jgi:hypothetical protein